MSRDVGPRHYFSAHLLGLRFRQDSLGRLTSFTTKTSEEKALDTLWFRLYTNVREVCFSLFWTAVPAPLGFTKRAIVESTSDTFVMTRITRNVCLESVRGEQLALFLGIFLFFLAFSFNFFARFLYLCFNSLLFLQISIFSSNHDPPPFPSIFGAKHDQVLVFEHKQTAHRFREFSEITGSQLRLHGWIFVCRGEMKHKILS